MFKRREIPRAVHETEIKLYLSVSKISNIKVSWRLETGQEVHWEKLFVWAAGQDVACDQVYVELGGKESSTFTRRQRSVLS